MADNQHCQEQKHGTDREERNICPHWTLFVGDQFFNLVGKYILTIEQTDADCPDLHYSLNTLSLLYECLLILDFFLSRTKVESHDIFEVKDTGLIGNSDLDFCPNSCRIR